MPDSAAASPTGSTFDDDDLPVWAYGLSFVVYVVLGYNFTSVVLNWIVGPLWLLATLYLLPKWLRSRERGRSGIAGERR